MDKVELIGREIKGGDVASFIPVAQVTRKSQVVGIRQTTMFSTDYVVDFMRETRIGLR
jgi:hypothetical protein